MSLQLFLRRSLLTGIIRRVINGGRRLGEGTDVWPLKINDSSNHRRTMKKSFAIIGVMMLCWLTAGEAQRLPTIRACSNEAAPSKVISVVSILYHAAHDGEIGICVDCQRYSPKASRMSR